MKFFEIYNKPYDLLKDKTFRWWLILGSTLFAYLFLLIFEPYGLSEMKDVHAKTILISLYVVAAFIFSTIQFNIQDFVIRKYTLGNTILWVALSFWLVGFVTAIIHEHFFNDGVYRFNVFVYFQGAIFSINIIPISIFVLIHYNITLKKRLKTALLLTTDIANKPQMLLSDVRIKINSENKRESLEIVLSNLLYITSSDNYIDVYYIEKEKILHNLIRYSLSGVEVDNVDVKEIWRCHKSYIVNKQKIESVSGNAAGYRIKLLGCDVSVPVSRKLNKNLSSLISE